MAGAKAVMLARSKSIAVLGLLLLRVGSAGEVRISFLSDDGALTDTAALDRFYRLPDSVTLGTLSRDILHGLQGAWKELGLWVPQAFAVVLGHEVNLPQPYFLTCHAGLLYPRRDRGYTFMEKAGGFGPFVRRDLDHREDLLLWLEGSFRGTGNNLMERNRRQPPPPVATGKLGRVAHAWALRPAAVAHLCR